MDVLSFRDILEKCITEHLETDIFMKNSNYQMGGCFTCYVLEISAGLVHGTTKGVACAIHQDIFILLDEIAAVEYRIE